MLVLKPKGRGNWHTVEVSFNGERVKAELFMVGQTITLFGTVYRIHKVFA